jgi:Ca-activated chloride channel family protein
MSCVVLVMSGGCATKKSPGWCTNVPSSSAKFYPSYAGCSAAQDSNARPAEAGSLPSLDEEIWVIARDTNVVAACDADTPGSGMMVTALEDRLVPMPLKHTDVQASVLGIVSTVRVIQKFQNPYDGKIEASYVFPLPQNAAVSEFLMVIGERRIRGIIRDRAEAEQIYSEARSQGFVASLLTQERPNVFTQKVANIEPGRAIDVEITYFNTQSCVDGWYEFVFPMVVGPRYNPAGSTNGIGPVAHGHHGISSQATEVEYLKPGERSGHDIALKLDLNAGMDIEESLSRTHVVTATNLSPGRMIVSLDRIS